LPFVPGIVVAAEQPIEEVVVHASIRDDVGAAGSVSWIDAQTIADIHASHPFEVFARLPGVWISRGSGQEHLTAIRSAVLTGAGACGEFLFLEDGIPIRPAGFCNVNNLFEVDTEQAAAIEVWRGPASAVFGGNALHGTVNVVTPRPEGAQVGIEAGAYGYYQLQAQFAEDGFGIAAVGTGTNGWRDDTGFGEQKLVASIETSVGGWEVRNTFSATNLNQETGAFVVGYEAYEDDDLRDTNPSPEAFRDAWSLRAASHWTTDTVRISPYLRRSRMHFLQHFLPGEPDETNDQTSAGVLATIDFTGASLDVRVGGQAEWAEGGLVEYQDNPTPGSPFLMATRPQGQHYDYDVRSLMAAGYYDLTWRFAPRTRLLQSARLEWLDYEYDNHALDGNTKEDGTPCGFGGCLYTRPADRSDQFTDVAGRIGVEHDLGSDLVYIMAGTGFRPPQVTELYRLQSGQQVADLDSERLYSIEAGYRAGNWSVAAFAERTRNFIFRDASGFNVSDGKTKALGVEFDFAWQFGNHHLDVNGTYAEHRYDFDREVSGGEQIRDDNMIDTAPRWLGSGRWC
jgi:outer membrane receptor protein involved in Fe transport